MLDNIFDSVLLAQGYGSSGNQSLQNKECGEKMKLGECWSTFYDFTSKASTVARYLALGGIAIVWLFRSPAEIARTTPLELMPVIVIFVWALAFDLLHYVLGAAIWGLFCNFQERKMKSTKNPEISVPSWLNAPVNVFFVGKIALVLLGYLCLFQHFFRMWTTG